ncbi:MAG: cyclase family protein, partial [Luteibaculum sp.]
AVIIRTLPNNREKLGKNYSNTNPPYFEPEALAWLREIGVDHVLVDLPSVDREHDGGLLLAHRAFWEKPLDEKGKHRTITELIFVPDNASDGWYWLNLMISSFENDAVPSRPVIYPIKNQRSNG